MAVPVPRKAEARPGDQLVIIQVVEQLELGICLPTVQRLRLAGLNTI